MQLIYSLWPYNVDIFYNVIIFHNYIIALLLEDALANIVSSLLSAIDVIDYFSSFLNLIISVNN